MQDAPPPKPRSVRRLAVAGVLAAAALVGIGAYLASQRGERGAALIGGPFKLVDGDGRAVTDRSFRGRYMLVYFGYTFCPDVCPTTLAAMADAADRLGPKADLVQPIFITIDPKRDTPAVIKPYAANFSPRMTGLTGSDEAVAQAARAYRVYYAPHRTGSAADDYSMDHSSIVYLMGPDGGFLSALSGEASGGEMAAQIGAFMK